MSPAVYTIDQAAEALQLSRATVYRLIADGSLRAKDLRPRKSKRSKMRIPVDEIRRLTKVTPRSAPVAAPVAPRQVSNTAAGASTP